MISSPLAITSMSGIFPGAKNGAELWDRILAARVAPISSLEKKWGKPRSTYWDPIPGKPDKTYSDLAFCLSDLESSQIQLGEKVLETLLSQRGIQIDRSTLALVLGTSWTDSSYFLDDAELFKKLPEPRNYSGFDPGQQLQALAHSAQIGGPLLAVDNACASSLYALDTAISLIQSGRARAAVVMGLNAYLPPFLYLGFSKLMALALHGQILPFAKNASGIIPGEAVAAILVEPLEEALYAGRKILGTVAGFGLSADGGERSVFAPSPKGQKLVYERAYSEPELLNLDYIEAHGTGTVIGDQTEMTGLDAFFAPQRKHKSKIPLGSAKAIFGHTLAAAGIVSIIKVLKIFEEKILPPHIPVEPHSFLDQSCLTLLGHPVPIPYRKGPIRAAVNSLGFGGSNSHLILESYTAEKKPKPVSLAGAWKKLALIDFDSAFGAEPEPTKCKRDGFPISRFPNLHHSPSSELKFSEIRGSFFPDSFEIDSQALKGGPHLLARFDPFQLQGLDSVHRLLDRNLEKIDSPQSTGIVVCNNLGGAMALKLSRYYDSHSNFRKDSDFVPSIESIASALPSMMSGISAYHFSFQGFHQTVSGVAGAFWDCLMSAPYWLENRCDSLFLGGGRFLKSPLDLRSEESGESLSFFLLETLERAERLQHKILATIAAVIPGHVTQDFSQACSLAGYRPEQISLVEINQLDPSQIALQSTQSFTGFLAEATGSEALARVLYSAREERTHVAIVVACRDRVVWTFFLELEPSPEKSKGPLPRELSSPLKIHYQTPTNLIQRHETQPISRHFLHWQESTAKMVERYLNWNTQLLKLASSLPKDAEESFKETEKSSIAAQSLPWFENLFRTSPLPHPQDFLHQVLDFVTLTPEKATAQLQIQEEHPYFFDHPLDHVPGILILEAALQLAQVVLNPKLSICEVRIQFRKFCEKKSPVQLELTPIPHSQNQIQVEVVQGQKVVSRIQFFLWESPKTQPLSASLPQSPVLPTADLHALHKVRSENVLISELLINSPSGKLSCNAVSPREGHFFWDPTSDQYSLLYLLEISRQFTLLAAHSRGRIPLDLSMNLISICISVKSPFFKTVPIELKVEPQPVKQIGAIQISQTQIDLTSEGQILGECMIKAQLVDRETYERQRKL